MSRTLIVLPDDSVQPILDAIDGAKKSLRIKMFIFTDPSLLDAVIAAHRRGVNVRIMLNPKRRNGISENDESRRKLEAAGIEVRDSNPAFDLTHEKSMVVDDTTAFVKSLNWQTKNLTSTRDYAIITRHAHEVEEITNGFEADWSRQDFVSRHLIWCRGNGRERIVQFINQTKHSLWLQNERYQDQMIIEHLVRAKERGVDIHVMARPPHTLKEEKLLEGVGTRHKVGLAIDFDEHANFASGVNVAADEAFGSFARGFLGRGGLAFFAQDANGFLEVKIGFD